MTNLIQFDFDDLHNALKSCLKEVIIELNLSHNQQEIPDRIGLREAIELTNFKKATIYKLTMQGAIPHEKFRNGRLVFSRKELEAWMDHNTVRKQSAEDKAIQHLAKVAKNRLNKH